MQETIVNESYSDNKLLMYDGNTIETEKFIIYDIDFSSIINVRLPDYRLSIGYNVTTIIIKIDRKAYIYIISMLLSSGKKLTIKGKLMKDSFKYKVFNEFTKRWVKYARLI